jgi:hypothetical protein
MPTRSLAEAGYRRELGDGLVLRWATAADAGALAELYAEAFRDTADSPPNEGTLRVVEDYMSGRHPFLGPQDFAVVADERRGVVLAAACLMRQEWDYGGIPFPVGRPEIVASDPDYRERGLVRAVFELIHARSAARGDMAQGITGIYYYYRQFGYEYALDLGGDRSVYFAAIPKLKPDQNEPYTLRAYQADDLPLAMRLYDQDRARVPVSARISPEYWEWTRAGQNPAAGEGWPAQLILNAEGRPVGLVLVARRRWGDALPVLGLAVEPGTSLAAVMPSVLRALQAQAQELSTFRPDPPAPARIAFSLGRQHPAYDVLGPAAATYDPPYAWYVRVPDLPGFIRQIAPALERRLAASAAAGHTGELRLNFYRGGLRLAFEGGRLTDAQAWSARAERWGPRPNAGFPPLVFLQLLFGHRSLAELRYAFPDAWADSEARVVLEALFPPAPAWVLPLD